MGILQEKSTRMYAVFLMYLMAALIVWTCFLCWLHGKEVQSLLFEREQTMVSSLVEQGISRVSIARAVRSAESTGEGAELLRQLGHTQSVSFRLFPAIDKSVWLFGGTAVGMAGILALLLCGMTVRFLWKREKLYRQAEGIIIQFSDGNFERHLPRNEEGSIYRLFSAVEELAAALRAQNEKEQHRKLFLKETISDISHQLKTPLAALHMYTEIIAQEPDHVETVERFSYKTMQSLERIERLVQTLLKVSRIDAGSIVFEKEWQSAVGLAESAAADLAVRAQQEGKRLVMEGDPAQMLFCDREWTREAVANLIKNALDHTGESGTVTVVWEQSPGMFRLSVADDGCGIAAEDMPHVFKRFYRSKRDSGRQGIGLGLPLARSIVEGQGGMLSVSSTPGQGSVFTISFFHER
ncbi:MAG: HAMP domain-containing histidine kinase [Lachnospiraceae bacterium]|nr:HAMP domain-containing histidine kinase [Lachnospiraceae bacterium]